ncbi:unnamed protein product [Symbiodinium sp. KB8]|nr:unnamed protein product [Symbiodinium sp. KB8]
MFSVEQRQSAHYVDLFNLATLVDFKAREGGSSQSKVLSIIAQDDTCEVALRRLVAWIHERRTGDRDAAHYQAVFLFDRCGAELARHRSGFLQSVGAQAGAKGGKGKGKEKKKAAGGKAATQGWVLFLNGLYSSSLREPKKHYASSRSLSPISAAQEAVLRRLWDRAKDVREGRRQEPQALETGGQTAAVQVVKGAVVEDSYARVQKKQNQIPLRADLIAEPSDDRIVIMLEALPRSEAEFYSNESNCIETAGKARQLQDEIEEQFAFVGGTYVEYCKYFHRSDLPNNMWVEPRSRLGMTGAGALARAHLKKPGVKAAVCDQSNAFTSVLVPDWMIPYQAVPPIPAGDVWELLPQQLRDGLLVSDWVCPCYMRLPMGCSHSVHILMSINLRIIGMTLASSKLLSRSPASGLIFKDVDVVENRPLEAHFGCSDSEWWERFSLRGANRRESGFSVDEWWSAVRKARRSPQRVFVIMHLFGGERRAEDVHSFVEEYADEAGVTVLMATVDLATDFRWDLAREDTQHELLGMMSGFVDLLLLGFVIVSGAGRT